MRPGRAARSGTLLLLMTGCAAGGPALPGTCLGDATGSGVEMLAALDTLMCRILDSTGVEGAALAVSAEGRLVHARGFGLADTVAGRPVEPTSRFRIASVSKPLTAVTALRLAERGGLHPGRPALDTLITLLGRPDRPIDERIRSITLTQLLRHTAGWDRYAHNWDAMFASDSISRALGVDPPAGLDAVLAHTLGDDLQHPPGTAFAYSNVGYAFAGRLLELATGLPYDSLVRREVLRPAGIDRMELGRTLPADRPGDEVRYYDPRRVRSVFPDRADVAFPDGGFYLEPMAAHGGWIASAVDLLRFLVRVDALPDPPDLLSDESMRRMLSRGADTTGYATGWYVSGPDASPTSWWHMGDLPGSRALLLRAPGGVGVAVLFNGSPPTLHPDSLRLRLLSLLPREGWPVRDLFREYP